MSEICEACSAFKLSKDAFHSSPFKENRMHQLGSFNDVAYRTYCPLCALLTKAYEEGPVPKKILGSSIVQGSWCQISDGKPDAGLDFWLIGPNYDLKIELSVRVLVDEQNPMIGAGRLIDPKSSAVPLDLIKGWVQRCEHSHSCQSIPLGAIRTGRMPWFFTVIDVEDKCLIQPDGNCRYLALSYQWGNSNRFVTTLEKMHDLASHGAISSIWTQLAQPIRDAILLTQKLGERYVWIDALCVSQQGESGAYSAKQNIQAMDAIYSRAICTILAADDQAPDLGLAGVGAFDRKVQQNVTELVPGVLVLARFAPEVYMARSRYRTRGWTYQEEQLSTRLLIFINDQVYFSCPSFSYSEDIDAERNEAPDTTLVRQQHSSRFVRESPNPPYVYYESVHAFTLRDLRFPNDVLRAFSGVESVQSQMLRSDVLAGLPTCLFDVALLWQPTAQLTRRRGFPSWSWAGWQGGVRWMGDTLEGLHYDRPQMITTWLRERTWIVWYHIDGQLPVRPVWSEQQRHSRDQTSAPTSETQSTPGYSGGTESDNIYGRSTAFEGPIASVRNQNNEQFHFQSLAEQLTNSGEALTPLLFTTLTVTFRIRASGAYLRYGSVDPVWEPNGRVIFLLLNRSSAVSGYVLLDESWRPQDMSTQEFLLLSEANYHCEYGRPHENHPYRKFYADPSYEEYHIMMVTWRTLDTGTKVAERAGIGRVLREAIKDSYGTGPEVKDIVLV